MRTAQKTSASRPLLKGVRSLPCISDNRSCSTRFGQLPSIRRRLSSFAPVSLPNLAGIGGCRHPLYHNSPAIQGVMTIMPLSVHLVRILLERSLIKHKNDNPARTAWPSNDLTNATMTYKCCRWRTNMRDLDLPEVGSS